MTPHDPTTPMTNERWRFLMEHDNEELTAEEINEGWHFCHEFDGLLVGPGMGEQQFCKCEPLPTRP